MTQDLASRIQRRKNIEAVKQLKARYLLACDRKDITGIRECFAPGAICIDYGPIGRFDSREGLLAVFEIPKR